MNQNGYNSDGYVRIPSSELPRARLRHLSSALDSSIAVVDQAVPTTAVTGYTEWVGTWQELPITLGWDWGVVQGIVVVINVSELRTNIRLIAGDGSAESPDAARLHFLNWIESMPWREVAILPLLDDGNAEPGR